MPKYRVFFWAAFSRIWTEYGDLLQIRENTDQKSCVFGHFLRSEHNSRDDKFDILIRFKPTFLSLTT